MQVPTGIADSLLASGATAAAPGAGTAIGSITSASQKPGVYSVTAYAFQTGTPDANGFNAKIKYGGTVLTSVPSMASPGPATTIPRVTLDGTQNLVIAVGDTNGSAGSVYNGVIIATRLA